MLCYPARIAMARIRTCRCSSKQHTGWPCPCPCPRAEICVRPCDDDGAEAQRGPSGRLSGRFRPGPPSVVFPADPQPSPAAFACMHARTRTHGHSAQGQGRPPAPHHVVAGSLVLHPFLFIYRWIV
jgi:hypothetical protein